MKPSVLQNWDRENSITNKSATFEDVFCFNPIVMAISDITTGEYLACNQAFNQLTELTERDVVGTSAFKLGLWDNPADRVAIMRGLYSKTSSFTGLELKFCTSTGRFLWGVGAFNKILFRGRVCLLSSIVDITERKNNERATFQQFSFLEPNPVQARSRILGELNRRQKEILHLVEQGYRNKEIGERLALSETTIKYHLVKIFNILKVESREEAARWFRNQS